MLFRQFNDEQRAELWAGLALLNADGLGANKRKGLVDFFGSPHKAVLAAGKWASGKLGIKTETICRFRNGAWREKAKAGWDLIRQCDAGILLISDLEYPVCLRETADAPLFLLYKGDLRLLRSPAVAVVGARDCTREGVTVAIDIVRGLSRSGITTISGMARGIDRSVHLAGLEGPGSSIGVLGTGINVIYPAENRDLYGKMVDRGLLLSEFLPGAPPKSGHFPVRNRIISGLSKAVLVVEAAMKSGTLITARHAVEQNRDVYAVPGSTLANTSEGCRDLIRRGAKVVFSAEDILLDLAPVLRSELSEDMNGGVPVCNIDVTTEDPDGFFSEQPPSENKNVTRNKKKCKAGTSISAENRSMAARVPLTIEEKTVVDFLRQRKSSHLEEIAQELEMQISTLSSLLSILEVKGMVSREPGMHFCVS